MTEISGRSDQRPPGGSGAAAPDAAPDAAPIAELVREVFRIGAALGGQVRERLGLKPTEMAALQALDAVARGPSPIGRLAASLKLSPAATTELVDRLERAGLVHRQGDTGDRRRVLLVLDPSAREVGTALLEPWARRIEEAAESLTASQARAVRRFLTSVLDGGRQP